MVEVEVIVLEDGKEYIILDKIQGSQKYIYFASKEDYTVFFPRKIILVDDREMIAGINDEEYEEAILLYKDKKGM